MVSSEVEVCNQALARLGDERIASLGDDSAAANFCQALYPQTRDEVLRSHNWNFAMKRACLCRLSVNPLFGWRYQYELPADFLRMDILNGRREADGKGLYEIEGRKLLTNEGCAKIRYVARVTDCTLYDSLFVEALVAKLAFKLAKPLTDSEGVASAMLQEYERIDGPLAKRVDANEDRVRVVQPFEESELVRRRYGGMF